MKSDTNFFVRSARSSLLASLALMPMALNAAAPAAPATATPVAQKIDLQKGASIAGQVCVGCHAVDGNSAVPDFPILAGQHAAYLSKQLHNFQVKPNAKKAERENAVMAGFAAALSEDDSRNVSAFYAAHAI